LALGLTLGGIPGVMAAVWLVKSLPLGALRVLVLAVVVYASVTLLRAGMARVTLPLSPKSAGGEGEGEGAGPR
jgi:uncharacterized membrane protein YfcA